MAVSTITAQELKACLQGASEHAILDLRREGEFAEGHLFYATNIPRSQLELNVERLLPRRDAPLTIAATGSEGKDGIDRLHALGYANVRLLEDELEGWTRSGGALYSGVNVPSKAFGEYIESVAGTPHVSPEELSALLSSDPDAILFDCRPQVEFDNLSIPGAVNCPGVELLYRFDANAPSAKAKVFVNCAGRTRSIIGAQTLIDFGVANPVAALRDGAMGWRLAGLPLIQGASAFAVVAETESLDRYRQRAKERMKRAGIPSISADECARLAKHQETTTYLFDIRDPADYHAGHLPGSLCAPGGQLIQTFDMFAPVHNARIVVIDSDGVRAPITALWLKQMGVRNVSTCSEGAGSDQSAFPTPVADRLMADARTISPTDACHAATSGSAVILDLASSKDYRKAHIPGSRFTERHDVAASLSRFETLILTSGDGRLARLVAAELRLSVDCEVVALEGGLGGWRAAGLPIDSGAGSIASSPNDVFYRPYDSDSNVEEAMKNYLDWERGLLERIQDEPGVRFSRIA